MLWRASIGGALVLVLGRVFGAAREFFLAHEVGPTEEMSNYVLASTILLAVAGLVSGVASALVIRRSGSDKYVTIFGLISGILPLVLAGAYYLLSDASRGLLFIIFALAVPFYAVYGVANGRLLRAGNSFLGMLTSALPPLISLVFLVLPSGSLVERAAWGNLVGSALMCFITWRCAHALAGISSNASLKGVVAQGLAISGISAINIATPVVDRFFANGFGAENLVLLNLGAILYTGAVSSIGIAMGNAAVSRASVQEREFPAFALAGVPILVGLVFLALSPVFVQVVLGGGNYGTGSARVLLSLCLVYALATPSAVLNQIHMRLWNRTAKVKSMVGLAAGLLLLNVVGNWLFILEFGVLGIALSTLTVQLVQAALLGWVRRSGTTTLYNLGYIVLMGGFLLGTA
ncbi:hypothetical protein [Arthrobacter globiformis]|uniref:hypothetical protein n=1 Tax=Arthrobacter globiformis TaxID=1665 RepID=UPI00279087E5|nr:hypothetical protein [Arthrobacter globiformis]MDQ0620115.1 peptidoglycan biosynthesis protein MviN/MurJ (putative lipid II flippase) [Arthrobacter globiformis]